MVDDYGLREKLDELELCTAWDVVTGPMVSRHTKRVSFKGGVVRIVIDSAPLRQELSYMKEDLITKLNEELGRPLVAKVLLS